MIDKKEFLSTYNMTEEDLVLANITWDELMLIIDEYEKTNKAFLSALEIFEEQKIAYKNAVRR